MEPIHILWPSGIPTGPVDFSVCVEDLQLGELAGLMFSGRTAAEATAFAQPLLTGDRETIAYRQGCIGDLLNNPNLTEVFLEVLSRIRQMRLAVAGIRENAEGFTTGGMMNGFKETLGKLEKLFGTKSNMIEESDLDNYYGQLFRATIFSYRLARAYVELLELLRDNLGKNISSMALKKLHNWVQDLCARDNVLDSRKILNEIDTVWQGVGAFSVDILVDRSFNIMGMELSSIRPEAYARPGAVTARPGEAFDGMGGLTDFPMGGATARFQECVITELGSAMRTELLKLRNAVARIPVSGVKELLNMEDQFSFYTGTARFCEKLRQQGAAIACPEESTDCFMDAEGAYPAALLLVHGNMPAANDVFLPRGGTVNFVTGANSSGKTTWLIATGQLQWLYQLGCWLPCRRARMSPAKGLYTLFASGESLSGEDSRMGMEAIRLASFRDKLTEETMVLLNEPMTSTNAGEGIEICMDLLYELAEKGVSTMMVSHYNEIYSMLKKRLEPRDLSEKLHSYVMEIDIKEGVTTYPYRLRQRDPDRSSHAHEIVSKVGVTLENMLSVFSGAGLPVHPEDSAWSCLHEREEE